ncbi:MAG: 1-acyl-sn-glycerol-3-phosphate acyltransferase [Desulfobacterales bacterium]|nr:1-acyl-sn-glycerol-3-phosphate acyltransferase [Desulfobacterales bacterium]
MKTLMNLVGRLFYWVTGWHFEPLPSYVGKKHVIIGFPHTGNMDTVRAFTGFRIARLTGHVMIKKKWFFWPMGWFLTLIGGIPVDRKAATGLVSQMADVFARRDSFYLAIVPEGTRSKVHTIKTGFWHIARAADVSIICWYLDNANKVTRWLGEFTPGDNIKEDLLAIHSLYAEAGYSFPLDVETLEARS